MFSYPHPLINDGAGRIKTDPINEERIRKVLDRYQQWAIKNNIKLPELPITKQTVTKSKIIFPLVGLGVGIVASYGFVHPGSRFIGKFFTVGMAGLGYWVADRYQKSHNSFKYFAQFAHYPIDIRKAIDNNDARYAHRWLKDNYLNIEP